RARGRLRRAPRLARRRLRVADGPLVHPVAQQQEALLPRAARRLAAVHRLPLRLRLRAQHRRHHGDRPALHGDDPHRSNPLRIGFVHKIKDEMFAHTGTKSITSAIENKWVDAVAAVPSLHAAFPFMMTLLFWHRGWKWRIPFGLYALAMGTALVYTGEHYAADVLLGYVH